MTKRTNDRLTDPTQMPTVNVGSWTTPAPAPAASDSVRMPAMASPASGARSGADAPGAGPVASDQRSRPAQPAQRHTKRNVIVVLLLVLVALAAWLAIWLFACNGASLFDPNARTGQAPYKTEAEMQAELDRVVEEGMFNISIASVIEFADGASEGTAYIENVPGNRYNMQVTITDDDMGEVLYESGVLAPNQYIEHIALSRDLEPGTYEATATFRALDPTTFDEIGQTAAAVSVVVMD